MAVAAGATMVEQVDTGIRGLTQLGFGLNMSDIDAEGQDF